MNNMLLRLLFVFFFVASLCVFATGEASAAVLMRKPAYTQCISAEETAIDQSRLTSDYTTRAKTWLEMCWPVQDEVVVAPPSSDGPGAPWLHFKFNKEVCMALRPGYEGEIAATTEMCMDSYGYDDLSPGPQRDQVVAICRAEAYHKRSQLNGYRGGQTDPIGLFSVYTFHGAKFPDGSPVPQPLPKGVNLKGIFWNDYISSEMTRRFQVTTYEAPIPTTTPSPTSSPIPLPTVTNTPRPQQQEENGEARPTGAGLQHGEQGFATGASQPTITPTPTNKPPGETPPGELCNTVRYDPYGRVFDAGTLEPVYDARVVLYEWDGRMFSLSKQLTVSPQGYITIADGGFNFLVDDGRYRLQVLPLTASIPETFDEAMVSTAIEHSVGEIKGYRADTNTVDIQLNNKPVQMYKNIYPAQIPYPDIVQAGKPEYRDLPVKTGLFRSKLSIIAISQVRPEPANVLIQGTASHPFARAKLISVINGVERVRETAQADAEGDFVLKVNAANYARGEYIDRVAINKWNDPADAPYISRPVDIIPQRLEGIAYDKDGAILPNTRVGLYYPASTLPEVETITDAKGYFSFSSEVIPPTTFEIRYGYTPGGPPPVNVLSVKDFFKQNMAFFEEKNDNPYLAKFSRTPGQQLKENKLSDFYPTTRPLDTQKFVAETPQQKASTTSQILTLVVVLIFLIVAGVLLFVFYIKKKNEPHLYE
jgi:hypothetical protein